MIDLLLAEIEAAGYRLSSLSHLDTGDWRAELRTSVTSQAPDELSTSDVGFGPVAHLALSMAFDRLKVKPRRTIRAAGLLVTIAPRATLTNLQGLGLLKPKTPIKIGVRL